MQKTILRKFIKVLVLALLLNSVIFYVACSTVLQKTFTENMLYPGYSDCETGRKKTPLFWLRTAVMSRVTPQRLPK